MEDFIEKPGWTSDRIPGSVPGILTPNLTPNGIKTSEHL